MNRKAPMLRPEGHVDMWVIYDHPTDCPDYYVARLWLCDQGPEPCPTDKFYRATTLEMLRALVSRDRVRFERLEGDDPVVLECWF